jgi:hypothetical protein
VPFQGSGIAIKNGDSESTFETALLFELTYMAKEEALVFWKRTSAFQGPESSVLAALLVERYWV